MTLLPFLTVITTGLINRSSGHFFDSVIYPSSIASLTRFQLLLVDIVVFYGFFVGKEYSFFLKIDFAMWFFDWPSLVDRCGYFWYIHFFILFCVWIINTLWNWLPCGFWALSGIPSLASRSRPMILFFFIVHDQNSALFFRPRSDFYIQMEYSFYGDVVVVETSKICAFFYRFFCFLWVYEWPGWYPIS